MLGPVGMPQPRCDGAGQPVVPVARQPGTGTAQLACAPTCYLQQSQPTGTRAAVVTVATT